MGFTAKAARVNRNLTQAEVAELLGIGRVMYQRLEKTPEQLTVEQMRKLCDALGVRHVGGNSFTLAD